MIVQVWSLQAAGSWVCCCCQRAEGDGSPSAAGQGGCYSRKQPGSGVSVACFLPDSSLPWEGLPATMLKTWPRVEETFIDWATRNWPTIQRITWDSGERYWQESVAQSNSTHSQKPKLGTIGRVTEWMSDCCVLGFAGALLLRARLCGHPEICGVKFCADSAKVL